MRILILGSDRLGAHLVFALSKDGHSVTVMDTSPDLLDTLTPTPEIEAFLASESLMEDLRNVGVNNVDVFLALSEDDNRNAMAAQVVSHIFHVPNVVCRIGDPQREKLYKKLGMKIICSHTGRGRFNQRDPHRSLLRLSGVS